MLHVDVQCNRYVIPATAWRRDEPASTFQLARDLSQITVKF